MLKVRVALGYKQKWRRWPSLNFSATPCQLDLEVAMRSPKSQSPKSQSPVSKNCLRRGGTIPSTSPSPPPPPYSFSHNKTSLLFNVSKRCLELEGKLVTCIHQSLISEPDKNVGQEIRIYFNSESMT